MKKFSILVLLLLISNVSFSHSSFHSSFTSGKNAIATGFDKAPYLLYTGNNTEMLLIWQMLATTNCTIEWGLDETYSMNSQSTTEYGTAHQHKITLTGLTPDTKYFYRVTNNGETKTGSFRTGVSNSETSVSLYTYGDTRTYPLLHDAVAKKMMDEIKLNPKSQTLILVNGDLVQTGNSESSWTNEFFDPQYTNIQELLANMPYLSTMGNHEGQGVLFGKYFPYPKFTTGRFYYSFDYGPIHITVLDQYTDYSPGSAQYTWLENDLASSTKPWKMIVDHEPGWTAYPSSGGHGNNTNVQNIIQPLCLKYDVSFVLSGHNHFYSRAVVNNVVHITTGGGGAPLYPPGSGRENVVIFDKSNHFCKIDINDNALKLTVIRSDGSIIETFDYSKSSVPGILITPSNPTLGVSNMQQLIPIIWPQNIANETVTWTSSNEAVATVSSTGLVTAIANGTATIIASILNDNTKSSTIVNVVPILNSINLDNCDALTNWKSSKTLVLNNTDKKEGTNCVEFTGSTTDEFKKVFTPAFNSGATVANGLFKFWYYVSDITKCGTITVELGSGGVADVNELSWKITQAQLSNGWNQITLKISNVSSSGTPNLSAINWFRIYDTKTASITTRIDDLQLGAENLLSTNNSMSHSHSDDDTNNYINVYPNPYKEGILSMDIFGFEHLNKVELKIFNLSGQVVYQEILKNKSHAALNIANKLTESVYFITVESGKNQAVKKLLTN